MKTDLLPKWSLSLLCLVLAACAEPPPWLWDRYARKIDETIRVLDVKEGNFRGTAGSHFTEAEIKAQVTRVACSPGQVVVEYNADMITGFPFPWVFEGRCG